MNLIQFVNKYDEAVEQGDVVVIARKQAQSLRGPQGEICPEVDLTATAYDPRACGVVAALYAEVQFEEVEPQGEQAGETRRATSPTTRPRRTARGSRPKSSRASTARASAPDSGASWSCSASTITVRLTPTSPPSRSATF
ncbi:MAG: hypothetical protein LC802_22345 [Acidobacteria bacterium]|nr:hypothetical protein [Acidobacteriota bacterium]